MGKIWDKFTNWCTYNLQEEEERNLVKVGQTRLVKNYHYNPFEHDPSEKCFFYIVRDIKENWCLLTELDANRKIVKEHSMRISEFKKLEWYSDEPVD
jgi:hypothetical protein